MALLAWGPQFSVGVEAIDKQHATLVDTLNQLHEAMLKGMTKSVTGPLLTRLVEYTHSHFAAEEKMMSAAKYPKFTQHCQHHRELTKEVEDFVGRYDRGEVALTPHLLTFLRDWLNNHIVKEDKEYGPWMNQHGVR